MKKMLTMLLVFAGLMAQADPSVTGVTAQQRYPWNGKVDISYTVENAGTEARELSVWAVDQTTGITNVAQCVTGETAYTDGEHHIIWDMAADGLTLVSTNVVFGVSYVVPSAYCVIDLSGGASATSYPISYLSDVPTGGWSDEYKTTKLVLRKISAGTFTMGSPTGELRHDDDEIQHQVTLTKDYYVGVFQVTQRQWELVMGTRPSYFNNNSCYASRPVESVSYNMIRGSSAGAGWPNSSEVDATSFLGVLRAKSGLMLDLPTEAQWEYACRAGTTTALNSGKNLTSTDQDAEMDKVGRYRYNRGSSSPQSCDWSAGTAKVGSYAPNAWGLYDMHGNVCEWCLDWKGSYSGDEIDPKGSSSGSSRVLRGGGWSSGASTCRSAYRGLIIPSYDYNYYGFRLGRTLSNTAVDATSGASDPVRVDLTLGTRTAAVTETITYSTEWVDGADEGAVAVVAVNGETLSEESGSGTIQWTPARDGTYELTHKVMVGGEQVGETLTAVFQANHLLRVTQVTAQQRYPWNGKVDISYTVENAGTHGRELSVWAVDWATGITNAAQCVTGETAYTDGEHHIVWDMAADGLTLVSTNVVFGVSYVMDPMRYCVIDLSGGPLATSYPVTYLDDIPSGGWSDEYKTTKLVLRKISAGTFTMGSPTGELGHNDNETQHQVTLTKDYHVGVFQVTQRQWELVMGTRPSYFTNDTYYASRPVEKVSYNMIRGASAGAGWPNSSEVDATSFLGVLRAKSGLTLDLPTEAQWEYACRAGRPTALNSGKNLTSTDHDAEMDKVGRYWYNGGSSSSRSRDWSAGTAEVGSYAPNAWGLYDMHGNVCEWCLDWYGPYSGDATDPKGPSSRFYRVLRGGSWYLHAHYCRSAKRGNNASSYGGDDYGFRLVGTLSSTAVDVKSGASDPVRVDLTPGTRTSAATETITYSTEWDEEVKGEENAVAVVTVNGETLSEESGSGTIQWTPTQNGTYELTHKVMVGGEQVGETLTTVFQVNHLPYVTQVTAQQRYPWNGKVDISYTVKNVGTEEFVLSVWAVDQTTGITNAAQHVTGETAYTSGEHHVVWDMAADGLTLVSTNVVFAVSYVEPPYCVIDLSGGTSASSYPVTYLDDIPTGGWSDEYKTTNLVLRKVSAGTFTMGSPTGELGGYANETQHQVTLTKDYYMGVFQVTQRQWELVLGTRPSYFTNDTYYASRPVESVSYNMIRGSSAGAGWPNSSEVDATSFLGVLRAKSELQLDLPTEAQWEYACRAGTTTALNSGKNLTHTGQDAEMDKVGRYQYNSGSRYSRSVDTSVATAKVGSYAPNAWGLYDMHGNVWEWCLDGYGPYSGDETDPKGFSSGVGRVLRGGSWSDYAGFCRSAYRCSIYPSDVNITRGFRLVGTLSSTAVVVTSGASDPVRVDLTTGTRTSAATETILYSTEWNEVEKVGEGGENAVAVVAVNGGTLSEESGSGTIQWTPTQNGTYELTHKVMVGGEQVGETLTTVFQVNHLPYVTQVTAQQRYPWNGKVDISYTVENVGTEGRELSVWAVDQTTGIVHIAKSVTGETAYTSGEHHIVWDMAADGLTLVSTNVVFAVSYVESSPLYCVIDLSGGPSATSYPVTYLDEAPSDGWSDEYKTTKLVLRKVKAGTFTMGSPADELGRAAYTDETQHQVALTKDYCVGVFQVTQRQWELVMGTRPSYFTNDTYYASRPVEQVSYNMIRGSSAGAGWPNSSYVDAKSFLGVLRAKSGLTLDLPTEAQWEYACRAGTTTALNSSKNLTSTSQDAEMDKVGRYWYNGGSSCSQSVDMSGATANVGSYASNAWGLYDMHGNVWEWCLDWYGSYSGDAMDPKGSSSGSFRVVRGGSWYSLAIFCRSAYRNYDIPSDVNIIHGFRLVRTLLNTAVDATSGASEPVRVDLTTGTRTAAATEIITYSTEWDEVEKAGEGGENAVAVVAVNGVTIGEQSGSGTIQWMPERDGTYELTHTVMDGEAQIGETLTATFVVEGLGPEPPVISPESGTTFDTSLKVTMACASEGATIHYTLDGSEPTMVSPTYSKKFRIYGRTIIKASAFYENGKGSETVVTEYAPGRCENPVITPNDGTEFEHFGQSVSIRRMTEDGVLRYTIDGSDPTEESPVYVGPFTIDETTTVKAKAFGDQYFDSGITTSRLMRVWVKLATPVVTADETFTGTKNKVVLSCANEGATIYYTLDGREPTASSYQYEKPFCVGESCTVKAKAVQYDYLDSDVAEKLITREWSIGDTMGKPDHAFETSGDKGFVRVDDSTAALGESMKSGAISDNQKSVLLTTVVGPGTLSFKWKTSCEEDEELHEWDRAEFKVDGDIKGVLDGKTDWIAVSTRIEGDGEHAVTWTYVKDDTESEGEDCLWVSEYVWESDYIMTQTTQVPVPYLWLESMCTDVVDEYDSYEKVAKRTAYNKRLTVEQCYVAGVDPESTTDDFKTTIKMVDGTPVIEWDPDLGIQRTYKVWGSEDLHNWQYPTNSTHRFFKVTVEMPQ